MHSPLKPSSVDALVARRLNVLNGEGRPFMTRAMWDQAQIQALQETVRHAQAHSPFYARHLAGCTPVQINSHEDLSALPFLTATHIQDHGHGLLCVSQSQVARVVTLQTSGSTGLPKRLSFSVADLAATSEFFFHGMQSLISDHDRVLVLLPFTRPDSVGHLLIEALRGGGIHAEGIWPPLPMDEVCTCILSQGISSVVGLPQHLLTLAETLAHTYKGHLRSGQLRSMLLCSDYAPPALRQRIEENCGCATFLHYGTTESGLGGGVECDVHNGCHLRESDLFIEIIDPHTGQQLPDGQVGELVLTTLQRQAMPLIRYRTGDLASLDRSPCRCGAISARLCQIQGRIQTCELASGDLLSSQDLDDQLFQIPGLLDYRATLDRDEREGLDVLHVEYQAFCLNEDDEETQLRTLGENIRKQLNSLTVVQKNCQSKHLTLGRCCPVQAFAPSHTLKRSINDQRSITRQGDAYAICA